MRHDASLVGVNDYDLDIYAWSRRQGALLRRLAAGERVNDADLDWPNIAEEIETVGRSERAALRSRILNVIEHLMKLQSLACDRAAPRLAGNHRPRSFRDRGLAQR